MDTRVHIPTSSFCNNHCVFCVDSGICGRPKGYDYAKIKEIMINRISDTDRILFTTNEPTMNERLVEYVKLARSIGYKEIVLTTNGRRLYYKSLCIALLKAGITKFVMSIHGHTAKVHDSNTRAKGSFNQAIQGLYNLVELKGKFNFSFNISSVLTKFNYKYIYEMITFFSDFCPDLIVLNPVIPQGNGILFFDRVIPYYSDMAKELILAIDKIDIESKNIPLCIIGFFHCLMPYHFKYLGTKENIIGDKDKKVIELDAKQWQMVKREECKSCIYFNICRGVYVEYVKRRGWNEFIPVVEKD